MAAAVYVSPGQRLWDALNSHRVDLLSSLLQQYLTSSSAGSSSLDNILEYRGDHAQRTLLATVIFYENVTMAKLLLEFGANVDSRDKHEYTPLMLAVSEGSFVMSKLLIDAGADVNANSASGQSPLLLAVQNGYDDIARLLLSNGAALGYGRQSIGHQAFCSAAGRGSISTVKLLIEHGVDASAGGDCISEALFSATCANHIPTMEFLLAFQPNINFVSSQNDRTTLVMASSHLDGLLLLMEHGGDINFVNTEGNTALMTAVMCRNRKAFENLFGFSPNLDIVDFDGWTALMYAVVNGTNPHDLFIEDLISAGANLHVKNAQGKTALEIAQAKNAAMYQRMLSLAKSS